MTSINIKTDKVVIIIYVCLCCLLLQFYACMNTTNMNEKGISRKKLSNFSSKSKTISKAAINDISKSFQKLRLSTKPQLHINTSKIGVKSNNYNSNINFGKQINCPPTQESDFNPNEGKDVIIFIYYNQNSL